MAEEELEYKSAIMAAAMILIALATAQLSTAVTWSDISEYVAGLILIAIYHFWFKGNGRGKKIELQTGK